MPRMTTPTNPHLDPADRIAELGRSVLAGAQIDRAQARELSRLAGDNLYDLFYWANKIRIKFVGRHVKFCSIVAAKVGNCSEDCGYCSQSKFHDTHVAPAKLSVDEMTSAMDQALANGASS